MWAYHRPFNLPRDTGAAEVRRMWIAKLVGETVVAPVRTHPEEERPLHGHRPRNHQYTLEEPGCLELFVRGIAVESDCDAEHLDRIEHHEERVVERGSPAGEHHVQGDGEPDCWYSDGHQGHDALGPRALRVELQDRPRERFFPIGGNGCRRVRFDFHAPLPHHPTMNGRTEHCEPARGSPAAE